MGASSRSVSVLTIPDQRKPAVAIDPDRRAGTGAEIVRDVRVPLARRPLAPPRNSVGDSPMLGTNRPLEEPTMDFSPSARIEGIRSTLRDFMAREVFPLERGLANEGFKAMLPALAKARACPGDRALGGVRPESHGGAGLPSPSSRT
ncbi:MAG: hypothetical protein U0610_30385 [bacterium]